MKKKTMYVFLTTALFLSIIFPPSASARLDVSLEIEKVAEHSMLVTLTWSATIDADRDWDKCELILAFKDLKDREIHRVVEMVSIKKGVNKVTGYEICETEIWEKTRKFAGNLNCGF